MGKSFDTLYHKGKGGALFSWRVWSEGDAVKTEYGQVDGKKQVSSVTCKPTNEGRSNARDAEQQADFEAEAAWKHKLERKYRKTPEEAEEQLSLPMLAHSYDDHKKKLVFPADVQPKLDGVRCRAVWEDGKIALYSRAGKPYTVPHISEMLADTLDKDSEFDGELYVHGMSCQTITSLVKKYKTESKQVEYWIYDMPVIETDDTLPWKTRGKILQEFLKGCPDQLVHVPHREITSHEQIIAAHNEWVTEGYEGAIVRHHNAKYMWGYRSHDLLKVKVFQDGEYEVVGCNEGVGKMEGCAVFICKTPEGKEFNCVMKGTMESRRQMYKDREKYLGKKLTLRYFELTDDKVPRFPVGVVFRDENDLG